MAVLSTQDLMIAHDARLLIKPFDWQVHAGEKWAVLGANGAGKSSLLHALLGVARLALPCIALDGQPLSQMTAQQQASLRVWVPQRYDEPFSVTVWQAFQSINHGLSEQASSECLAQFDLLRHQNAWVHLLSGGERQRLTWAMAAARCTDDTLLWLLDEPLAAQDLLWQHRLLERLKTQSCAVVAAVHDINQVTCFASHVLALVPSPVCAQYEVVSGTVQEMMKPEVLSRIYGVPLQPIASDDGLSHWWRVDSISH